jgi:hypothetical protein
MQHRLKRSKFHRHKVIYKSALLIQTETISSRDTTLNITDSMEQNPSWEANTHSATQETPRSLWNRVKKTATAPYPKPHESSPHLPTVRSILTSTSHPLLGLQSGLFPSISPTKYCLVSHHSHACYVPRRSHPPWFDHPNIIWWSVQVMKLLWIYNEYNESLPFCPLSPNTGLWNIEKIHLSKVTGFI